MQFDFDTVVDRRNSSSIKWNWYPEDVLPMWVADMDFKTPEPILRALSERVAHGVFGYEIPSKELRQTIVAWLAKQYDWLVQPEEIVFLPGLVNGLNLMNRIFGQTGDSALMLTPVYHPFLTAPTNNGMSADKVTLRRIDPVEPTGAIQYEIDFDALEKAITPRTRIFIHCHPHNPVGKEYTVEENRKLAEFCLKHGLLLLSDEIHCDLMLGGARHAPVAALSAEIAANTITLMAPSKTFNIPSLKASFAVIQNPKLRKQWMNNDHTLVGDINALGLTAMQAAYGECGDWLAALLSYLTHSRDTMLDFVAENLPGVTATIPNATYLGWLNFNNTAIANKPYDFFLKEAKVALNDGAIFGPGGEGFVRFNFGCTGGQTLRALERMAEAFRKVS
jgi:cystathionine beta-lyase